MHLDQMSPRCVCGGGGEHISLSSLAQSHSAGLQPQGKGLLLDPATGSAEGSEDDDNGCTGRHCRHLSTRVDSLIVTPGGRHRRQQEQHLALCFPQDTQQAVSIAQRNSPPCSLPTPILVLFAYLVLSSGVILAKKLGGG